MGNNLRTKMNTRYEEILPVRFRVGDIVEAKATLTVIQMKGSEFKLIAVLRSLTLWDTQFTQVSFWIAATINDCYLMQTFLDRATCYAQLH